jgi:Kef-type K+ transport system membrane component KefB
MPLVPTVAYYALLEVFIFLAVAELLHSFAQKAGLPTVVSDLLLGMVLSGFAVGGLLNSFVGVSIFVINSYVLIFADFSVILLLFAAGLGGGFSGLRRAGGPAVLAALAGDLVPFALVFGIFSRVYPLNAALLLGVAGAATSSAVVASLVRSGGLTGTRGGQFLMNVAALDDVVALLLLSAVLTIVGGQFDIIAVTGGLVESVAAWVVLLLASVLILPRLLKVPRLREAQGMPFLFLFVLVVVVVSLGFSAVIGAFIAGLAVAESLVASRTRQLTDVLLVLFGSLFFVVTGAQFDFHQILSIGVVALALLIAGLAAVGKVAGVYPFARWRLGSGAGTNAVAIGMIPRAEIGLIVGSIGFTGGILNQSMLGEILLMSIVTTLVGAVLFRRRMLTLFALGEGLPTTNSLPLDDPSTAPGDRASPEGHRGS